MASLHGQAARRIDGGMWLACTKRCWPADPPCAATRAVLLHRACCAPLGMLRAVLSMPCTVLCSAVLRSLVENAAITTGRVAWVCPEPLAPLAPHFIGPW